MKYLSVIAGLILSFGAYGVSAQEVYDIWDPDAIKNMDLVHYAEEIDRYLVELGSSESSTVNAILEFDLARLKSYSVELRGSITNIWESDRADYPHSSDVFYLITYASEGLVFSDIVNEDMRWVMRTLSNMMMQATRSNSAGISNGLSQFDYQRQILALNRLDQFIANYEENNLPTDQPQDSNFEQSRRAIQ